MKRITFITTGIIINLIVLGAPLLFTGWHILIAYLGSLLYLLLTGLINSQYDRCPPSYWFFPYKKIYHSDLGELYCEAGKPSKNEIDKVYIYEQKWLSINKIAEVDYNVDIEYLKKLIKNELDRVYSLRIKDEKSSFKKWDGYLDTQSKRDDKLNKLGI